MSGLDPERLRDYLRGLFGHLEGALTATLIYLGDALGLYQALASGPADSGELAARTGLSERWLREWLYNQAAARLIEPQPGGRFALSPEGRAALADEHRDDAALGHAAVAAVDKRAAGLVGHLRGDGRGTGIQAVAGRDQS